MEKIEKTIKFNKLYSVYHSLLSKAQDEILNAYFGFDLSISEIATERNISRAAVEDALQKGCAKLEEFEKELHIVEDKEELLKNTSKLRKMVQKPDEIEIIDEIERRLK